MTVPTNGLPPDYQHPRWVLYTATLGFAFFYICALVAANIIPHGEAEHGWPFVYMVREIRVPGGLSIDYGPWPFYDPPLVWFRPIWLTFNILCGGVLTVASAAIPIYWLRTHRKPVQFSLRSLLVLDAIAACLLGILKFYNSGMNLFGMIVVLPVFILGRFVVYAVPVGLAVVAAHWAVVRSANSVRRGRWIGIHWLTWLAAVVVAGPLLHYSLLAHTQFAYVRTEIPSGFLAVYAYGWPVDYIGNSFSWWAASEDFPISSFHPLSLIADIVVAFVLIASIGFVVDRWICRVERGIPMRLRMILPVAFVVCVLIWVLNHDRFFRPDWYDYPFWLVGIAAVIWSVQFLLVRGVTWSVRRFCR
jgi:hypothetical protein